jgi:DNA-binding response OmpR family regulator
MKNRILLVEDNVQLNETNRRYLELAGYQIDTAFCLEDARKSLASNDPDVILLDVMLPDGDGIEFCEEITGKTAAEIIFLTAKTSETDQVRGLMSGGSVYLTKPYSLKVMLSYVEKALRRRATVNSKIPKDITYGSFRFNTLSAMAFWNDTDLLLSQKEFSILLLLAENNGKPVSGDLLFETVWNVPSDKDKNTLRRHISTLKTKLSEATDKKLIIDFSRDDGYILSI